ncbi:MAG: hypothetical protein QOG75_1222, partial [Mycobacterium sp.]|nr:hypothetical protein [Mycobacterium sp.]
PVELVLLGGGPPLGGDADRPDGAGEDEAPQVGVEHVSQALDIGAEQRRGRAAAGDILRDSERKCVLVSIPVGEPRRVARSQGVHPQTAYRWFREGSLPVPAVRVKADVGSLR